LSVIPGQLAPAPAPARQRGAQDVSALPVQMARCIQCGGGRLSAVYPEQHPWLKQCDRCGLRFAHPQPSDDELARIYDADYYKTFGFDPARAGRYRSMKQASFDALLAVVERHFRRGRLLDVGSALGDLILAAQRRGWKASGVEPNRFAAEMADDVVPGATFTGTLEQLDDDQTFDLVTCVDVIEHLRRPDETLRRMRDVLRPGGGLVVVTNDVQSAASRAMGPRWVHYHLDHLWYFSRRTLAQLVEAAGLEVVAVRQARKIFNLSYVLGILAHSPNHRPLQQAARAALRWIPERFLRMLLPPVREGMLLLARRPALGGTQRNTPSGPG
jgi:2-polyprenyl-3-methyl-5-hydroxy-6-metoxy-1,4-benzoquinol methylase